MPDTLPATKAVLHGQPDPRRLDRARFSRAVQQAMHERGLDQYGLAEMLGISQPAVSDWLNEKKSPGRKNLQKVIDVLGLRWENLAAPPEADRSAAPEPEGAYLEVKVYELSLSAGTGRATFEEQVACTLRLHRFILERVLGVRTYGGGPVGIAYVAGDCMLPDLRDGDCVFFEHTGELRGPSGRYVLWLNDEPVVKRVQHLADGSLEIRCENRTCGDKDELLVPNEDGTLILQRTGRPVDFRVIGPVLWPNKTVHAVLMDEVKAMIREGYFELARQMGRG